MSAHVSVPPILDPDETPTLSGGAKARQGRAGSPTLHQSTRNADKVRSHERHSAHHEGGSCQ